MTASILRHGRYVRRTPRLSSVIPSSLSTTDLYNSFSSQIAGKIEMKKQNVKVLKVVSCILNAAWSALEY